MKIFPILVKRITQVIGGEGGANAVWTTLLEYVDSFYHIFNMSPEQANWQDQVGQITNVDGENVNWQDAFIPAVVPSYAESVNLQDSFVPSGTIVSAESLQLQEAVVGSTTPAAEQHNYSDAFVPTINPGYADSAQFSDGLLLQASGINLEGDSWTDQASTGTNHGSETTMIVKGKSTLANDERRAYLKLRIDKFVGFTRRSDKVTGLHLRCANGGLTAVNVTAEFRTGSTDPFTESTINWSNQPSAYGTSRASLTTSIPTGAAALQDWFLSDADETAVFGSGDTWLLIILTAPSAAVPPSVTIDTRDGTTMDPYMDIFLSR